MIPRAEFPVVQGIIGTPVKSPMEIIVDTIVVDHTARILDLEKQVADLRAALNKEPTL